VCLDEQSRGLRVAFSPVPNLPCEWSSQAVMQPVLPAAETLACPTAPVAGDTSVYHLLSKLWMMFWTELLPAPPELAALGLV
jgi:hypothetical protein